MTFIRHIALILISISLIGCASTKTPNTNKPKISSAALGKELMDHVLDEALVDYFNVFAKYDKIINSDTATEIEKTNALSKQYSAIEKLIASADTDYTAPLYSEEEQTLAYIDVAAVMKKAELNHIDLNNGMAILEEITISLPTHKAARAIRVILIKAIAEENK